MDITRNWRLKTNRSQLLATRCPTTGEIRLPQQTASLAEDVEIYDNLMCNLNPPVTIHGERETVKVAAR